MDLELDFTETAIDTDRLAELEHVIERGLNTFVDVGNALMEIRDSRLYRNSHATFEEYCRERWNIQRAHAYRLIEAATTVNILSPIGDILPQTESQARPLTQLEPEQQREVWQRAIETAPDGKVTAEHVQKTIEEVIPEKRKDVHVSFNSGNNEWYTPPEYIESARSVLGEIDLDPASSSLANRTVMAKTFFTVDNDGLKAQWTGRVWMNPPYSSDLVGKFASKIAYHFESGDISEAIVLVNNATETRWFNEIVSVASAVSFVRGRIKYIDVNGEQASSPLQGQAFIYLGEDPSKFLNEFSKYGWGAVVHERIRVPRTAE